MATTHKQRSSAILGATTPVHRVHYCLWRSPVFLAGLSPALQCGILDSASTRFARGPNRDYDPGGNSDFGMPIAEFPKNTSRIADPNPPQYTKIGQLLQWKREIDIGTVCF